MKESPELNSKQNKVVRQITGWQFTMYLLKELPMGYLAGLRVEELTTQTCVTSVPFKWLTKNPFRSMYFAVQSMAAELSTASTCLLATSRSDVSVAFIIVDCKAKFYKKAISRVYFTCENASKAFDAVERCIETGEAETATFTTTGRMGDGTEVSEFEFTWSFKKRGS